MFFHCFFRHDICSTSKHVSFVLISSLFNSIQVRIIFKAKIGTRFLTSINIKKLVFFYEIFIYNFLIDMERQVKDMKEILSPPPNHESPGQITITVQDPILYQKEAFNYFLYNVIGKDKDGLYSIRRRYSDFDLLRKRLGQRWLGIYLPPISGKRAENNPLYILKIFESNSNESKYAQTRRKFLKYFCEGIASRPFLYYCDLFQLFIRGGPDYETAISSCIVKEYSYILNAYELSFNNLVILNQTKKLEELLDVNQKHLAALRQSENCLLSICQKIYKATQARELFNIQFNITMKKALPEYQERFLLSHVNKERSRLILNRTQQFAAQMLQFQKINAVNPLQKFLDMIMYEIREVKAFIEAIENRKQAQKRKIQLKQKISEKQNEKAKLQSGAFSFKTFFKTGSKQLKLNEIVMKIQILRNELICIEKMIVIMLMNTNFEIGQYRLKRGKQYSEIFHNVAQRQVTQMGALYKLLQIPLAALK